MARDLDYEDASRDFAEDFGPAEGNTSTQGPSLGEASASGILAIIAVVCLLAGFVIGFV